MMTLSSCRVSQMFHKDLLAKCKKKNSEIMGWLVNLFLVLCSTDGATKCHRLATGCLSQAKLYCKCDTGCLSQVNYIVSRMQIM